MSRFITDKGFDLQYGARSLKRTVQTYIEDLICDLIMSGNNHAENKGVVAELQDNNIKIATN